MAVVLGDAFVRVRPNMNSFPGEVDRGVAGAERGFKSRMGGFAKVAATALGGAAVLGAAAFTKNGIKLEAEFGRTMNKLQAQTGVPAKGLKQLSDLALKMGADTQFSASDASQAMLELARGGMSAAVIKGGALQGTLTLAAAGELKMGEAANVAVKAMGQFNLKGSEMDSVASALAGAANASSSSVRDLSQALAQGGLAANAVGFSIQETTGVLAAFSNAGLEGADAGTSLKTFLDRLVPTTTVAADAFEKFGLMTFSGTKAMQELAKDGIRPVSMSYDDVTDAVSKYLVAQGVAGEGTAKLARKTQEFLMANGSLRSSFVKANGEYKSAAEIAGILQDKLGGLSASQRKVAMSQLFGSDAQRAAMILQEEGAAGIRRMLKATTAQNAAQNAAQASMKGTAGALERMRGAIETAQLAWGQAIKPVTRFGATLIAEIAGGAVPLIQDFGKVLNKTLNGIELDGLGDKVSKLDIAGPLGKIRAAVMGLDWESVGAGFSKVGAALRDAGPSIKDAGKDMPTLTDGLDLGARLLGFFADHADLVVKALPYLIGGFIAWKAAQAAANTAQLLSLPIQGAAVVSNIMLANSNRALATQLAVLTGAQNTSRLAQARATFATIASTAAQKVAAGAARAWAGVQWVLNAALSANPIGLVVLGLVALGAAVVIAWKKSDTFRRVVTGAWNGIKRAVSSAWENGIKPALSAFGRFIRGVLGPVVSWLWNGVVRPYFKLIGTGIKVAWVVIRTVLQAWWAFMKVTLFPVLRFLWERVVRPVFTSIGGKIRSVWTGFIKPAFNAIREGVSRVREAFKTSVSAIGRIWDGLKEKAAGPVRFVVNTVYNNGIRKVVNAIPGVTNLPELKFDQGGVMPGGRTPGRDIHRFVSPTGGVLNLGGGEAFMRPEFTDMVGGAAGIKRLNDMARKRKHRHGKLDASWMGSYFLGGVLPMPAATSVSRHSGYPWAQWAGDLNGAGDDTGKAVVAWKDGMIASTQSLTSSYGNHIRMNHLGNSTLYAHLSGFTAGAGQVVKAGQQIGRVGSTGNSSGPHLHFEVAGGNVSGSAQAGGGNPLAAFMGAIKEVKNFAGDVKGFFSQLSGMGGWGGMIRQMVGSVLNGLRGYVNDKIPGPGPFPSFDQGGVARGRGHLLKNTLRPERTLSPSQTEDFEELLQLLRDGALRQGPLLTIENMQANDPQAALRAARAEVLKLKTLLGR